MSELEEKKDEIEPSEVELEESKNVSNVEKPGVKSCTYTMKTGPRKGSACGTPVFNANSDKCFRHNPKAPKPSKPAPQAAKQPEPQQAQRSQWNPIQRSRPGTRNDLVAKLNKIAEESVNKIIDESEGDKPGGKAAPVERPPPPKNIAPPPRPVMRGSYKDLPTDKLQNDPHEYDHKNETTEPIRPPPPLYGGYRAPPINKHKLADLFFNKGYCKVLEKAEDFLHEKDWIDTRGAAEKLRNDIDAQNAWRAIVGMYFPDVLPETLHPGYALVFATGAAFFAAATEKKIEKVFQIPGHKRKRDREPNTSRKQTRSLSPLSSSDEYDSD